MSECCRLWTHGDWMRDVSPRTRHEPDCCDPDPVSPPSAPAEPASVPAGEARPSDPVIATGQWMPDGPIHQIRQSDLDRLSAELTQPVESPRVTPSERQLEAAVIAIVEMTVDEDYDITVAEAVEQIQKTFSDWRKAEPPAPAAAPADDLRTQVQALVDWMRRSESDHRVRYANDDMAYDYGYACALKDTRELADAILAPKEDRRA